MKHGFLLFATFLAHHFHFPSPKFSPLTTPNPHSHCSHFYSPYLRRRVYSDPDLALISDPDSNPAYFKNELDLDIKII